MDSTENAPLCSKCGKLPRADADSNNPWCRECRAEYQRDYTKLTREQKFRTGFARGIAAMRDLLVEEFRLQGGAGFTGTECAHLIRNAPGPQVPVD